MPVGRDASPLNEARRYVDADSDRTNKHGHPGEQSDAHGRTLCTLYVPLCIFDPYYLLLFLHML